MVAQFAPPRISLVPASPVPTSPAPASPAPPHRLAEVPLFARLPPAVLDELARSTLLRRYPDGQILCNEGDPGDSLLLLEEGRVRISRFAASGQEVVLAVSDAPAALGELALLDGALRSATVAAQGPVAVRVVPRKAFAALLQREPELVNGLLTTLAQLVRETSARYADVLGLDVPGRLAKWLLARAEADGSPASNVVRPGSLVTLGRTQAELAAELGTTRESLNRALRGFADLGIVTVKGDRVELHDPARLAAYVG